MLKIKTGSKIRKSILIPLIVVVALAAAGLGYTYWKKSTQTVAAATQSTIKTAEVRRGNLTISASGTGTLVAGRETNLSFPMDGKVAVLNVQTGDRVTQGQVLAEMEDVGTLQTALTAAQLDLKAAQQALDDLKNDAPANLANAQLSLANAKDAASDAKSALKSKGMQRCTDDETEAYYSAFMRAQKALDDLGDGGGNKDYYLAYIVPAKNKLAAAYATYMYCAQFTEYEIDSTHAKLSLADIQLNLAQTTLATLQKNEGLDPDELAAAQNKVANAQVTYEQAKNKLDKAVMKAPFDGTIISVAGLAGDEVDTGTFIVIADMQHPEVEFTIDETDIDKVSLGAETQITFDAIPDQTFSGKVTQLDPSLQTVSGYQVLKGTIQMDLSKLKSTPTFIAGLNAAVEVIGGKAENTLLIPIEALRDLGDGQYSVFVMDGNNKLQMKTVTVGLMDATYAEIKDGLNVGDVVSTGKAETK